MQRRSKGKQIPFDLQLQYISMDTDFEFIPIWRVDRTTYAAEIHASIKASVLKSHNRPAIVANVMVLVTGERDANENVQRSRMAFTKDIGHTNASSSNHTNKISKPIDFCVPFVDLSIYLSAYSEDAYIDRTTIDVHVFSCMAIISAH